MLPSWMFGVVRYSLELQTEERTLLVEKRYSEVKRLHTQLVFLLGARGCEGDALRLEQYWPKKRMKKASKTVARERSVQFQQYFDQVRMLLQKPFVKESVWRFFGEQEQAD